MIRIIFISLILVSNVALIKAQNDSLVDITESNLILVSGVGYNGSAVAEFGFGSSTKYISPDTDQVDMKFDFYVGSEFWFNNDQTIYVPKISGYIGLYDFLPIPVTVGGSLLYAFNPNSNSFGFRLEYGIPLKAGRIFYSYNIPINNREFVKSNIHQVTLSWAFRVGKTQKYKTFYNKETDSYLFEDIE